MRVFWWQGGIHIEPEGEQEHKTLLDAVNMLREAKFGDPFADHPKHTGQSEDQDRQSDISIQVN